MRAFLSTSRSAVRVSMGPSSFLGSSVVPASSGAGVSAMSASSAAIVAGGLRASEARPKKLGHGRVV